MRNVKKIVNFWDIIFKPWGHKEWSGGWGDGSNKWTDKLKELLKVENKNDGIFWMSINDFIKEFS